MSKKLTISDIMEKFDHFHRTPSGSVIIHPGITYGLIEVTEEFTQALKKDLKIQMSMASNGIDDLSPMAKFVIMLLQEAY